MYRWLLSSSLLSSLELSDTQVYEPSIRTLFGSAPHSCEAIVLKPRTVPLGTALNGKILGVTRRGPCENGVLGPARPRTELTPQKLRGTDYPDIRARNVMNC